MAPQQNNHQIHKISSSSLNNLHPLIKPNDTTDLKSVHAINMSSWVMSNHSFINNSLENRNSTTNTSLNFPKREHTASVLPSSLNIWLTHGL